MILFGFLFLLVGYVCFIKARDPAQQFEEFLILLGLVAFVMALLFFGLGIREVCR